MERNTGNKCLYIFRHNHLDYVMEIKIAELLKTGLIRDRKPVLQSDRRKTWLMAQLAVHQFLMSIKKDQ